MWRDGGGFPQSSVGYAGDEPSLASTDGARRATADQCIEGALAGGAVVWQRWHGMAKPDLGPMGLAGFGCLAVLSLPRPVRVGSTPEGF
jgi:hypothetical protein